MCLNESFHISNIFYWTIWPLFESHNKTWHSLRNTVSRVFVCVWWDRFLSRQVFPDVPYQQGRDGAHRTGETPAKGISQTLLHITTLRVCIGYTLMAMCVFVYMCVFCLGPGLSSGVLRVEDVSGALLGLLPSRRLLPQAVRRPARIESGPTVTPIASGICSPAYTLFAGPQHKRERPPLVTLLLKSYGFGFEETRYKKTSRVFFRQYQTYRGHLWGTVPISEQRKKTTSDFSRTFLFGIPWFSTTCCLVLHIIPNHCTMFFVGSFWGTLGCVGLWDNVWVIICTKNPLFFVI